MTLDRLKELLTIEHYEKLDSEDALDILKRCDQMNSVTEIEYIKDLKEIKDTRKVLIEVSLQLWLDFKYQCNKNLYDKYFQKNDVR